MTIYDFYVYNVLIYPMYEYLYNMHTLYSLSSQVQNGIDWGIVLNEISDKFLFKTFFQKSTKKKTPILSTLGCSIDFGWFWGLLSCSVAQLLNSAELPDIMRPTRRICRRPPELQAANARAFSKGTPSSRRAFARDTWRFCWTTGFFCSDFFQQKLRIFVPRKNGWFDQFDGFLSNKTWGSGSLEPIGNAMGFWVPTSSNSHSNAATARVGSLDFDFSRSANVVPEGIRGWRGVRFFFHGFFCEKKMCSVYICAEQIKC